MEKSIVQELSPNHSIYAFNYRRLLFLLTPVFLVGILLIFKFSVYNGKIEKEFLNIKKDVASLEQSKELDEASFYRISSFIKKHPEMAAPYEPILIQKLVGLKKGEKKESFVAHFLNKRSLFSQSDSYYTRYGKTTLLIDNEEFSKALTESIQLKEAMLGDASFWENQKSIHFGSLLFTFNLVRIGMLYQALKKPSEELGAWREVQTYLGGNRSEELLDPKEVHALASHFSEQGLALKEYISHREKLLASSQ